MTIRQKRPYKIIYTICFVVLALVLSSCRHNEVYYHFHEIRNAEWSKNDTLIFDIDSTAFELNQPYDVTIEVTNNINYPYQNIWFFIQSNFTSDSVFQKSSKEYLLADNTGKWLGSGFGSLFQISLSLEQGIIFKEKRNYRIKIEHGMRDEPLMGIEKVGIKITKLFK